jgi:hypothetical protein
VTDDDARPVDPPRATATPAHQSLGFVLGAEVRVLEARRLLEHVLAETALVAPRRGDRARVVEAACLHRLRALDRVIGADDVREVLIVDARLQVVDAREMEEVVDLAREPALVGLRHAEVGLRQIALDRDDAARARAPEGTQRLEFRRRLRPHEREHALAAREQALDEVAADETGRSRHEIRHLRLPDRLWLSLTVIR